MDAPINKQIFLVLDFFVGFFRNKTSEHLFSDVSTEYSYIQYYYSLFCLNIV